MMIPILNQKQKRNFSSKIDWSNPSGCWAWTGASAKTGRGQVRFSKTNIQSVTRIAWRNWVGEIPEGFHVLHQCDNPGCVRPDHLFLGTHNENMKDKVSKGRHHNQLKTHCPKGHLLEGSNLYAPDLKRGRRQCKTCSFARKR